MLGENATRAIVSLGRKTTTRQPGLVPAQKTLPGGQIAIMHSGSDNHYYVSENTETIVSGSNNSFVQQELILPDSRRPGSDLLL